MLLIVDALMDGPLRYGDLAGAIEGIAPNVLAARLRRLEEHGLVIAERYSDRPPRHLYALTEQGRGLAGVLRLLADWGSRHGGDGAEPLTHDACGGPLEARWWCPACDEPAGTDDDDDLYAI